MPHEPLNAATSETSTRRRRWLFAGVLAFVAILAGVWLRSGPSPEPEARPPDEKAAKDDAAREVVMEIEPDVQRAVGLADAAVEERAMAETIQTTGVVGPDETRVARIRPLAEGRITRVAVRVGDRVATGQTLLTYDSITGGELISQYRSAVAALERATAEADVARRALERADSLVEMGAVATSERERRSAEHQRTVAEMNSARAALTNLEQKLRRLGVSSQELTSVRKGGDSDAASRGAVTAPFGGVVTEVHAASGEIITPDRELFTVADLTRVWLQGDVYQRDIAKIRIGQNAIVSVDAYPGESFSGRVTHVSDVLDPDTRTAKVRCEVPNAGGRLKLQMFATLALPISSPRHMLAIPARAVQDIDGVQTVFVRLGDEKFGTRAVRVGARLGDVVEVAHGLKAGERVVTDGALMLKSRLKLRVEEEEGEGKKK